MKIHSNVKDFLLIFLAVTGFLLAGINVEAPRYRSDLILAVMLAIILASLLETYRRLQTRIDMVLKRQHVDYYQIEALLDIYSTLKLDAPLPASRSWAISPDMSRILLQQISKIQPECIVECGSGLSTILMAAALKKNGKGKLLALEHSLDEVQKNSSLLTEHHLEAFAEIVHAPLCSHDVNGETMLWYDTSFLNKINVIDLLFIDGPPQRDSGCARYPTLHLLKRKISTQTTIILDDAGRQPEQSTVKRWKNEFKEFSSQYHLTEYGTHIITLSPPNEKNDTLSGQRS